MNPTATACPQFLSVLGQFYGPEMAEPLDAVLVAPDEIPQPYRHLLVHGGDMTSRLTQFHEEAIELTVLERTLRDAVLRRHIVLQGVESHRAREYGAATIYLGVLGQGAKRRVLDGRLPLGGILNAEGIQYRSCPGGFFQIQSNRIIEGAFGLPQRQTLFGRCNCLWDGSGRTIAEVVEILPPTADNQENDE